MAKEVNGKRGGGEERGKVSGSRVISPSQHRPLNSTPLVETKSDTRKAKLLQMHKPSSVRPISILFRSYQLLSLPPYSPTRSLQPPSVLVALGRLFLFSLSTLSPFDSCSFQLPTYTQSTLFIAKTSFCNSSFLFLFLSILSIFLLCVSLFFFLSFFIRCSRTLHFLVNVLFFPLFFRIRENPCALGFFSITPFPIERYPLHALSSRAAVRLPII